MTARHLPALVLVVASLQTPAAAAEPPEVAKSAGHDFSLTGSVLLLNAEYDTARYNLIELTGEWRFGNKVGLAAIVGGGRMLVEDEGYGYELGVFDLGGQAYYCLIGDFDHGLQLGVESVFVALRGADRYNGSVTASLGGISFAPFVGYKLALRSGFTVIVQAGGGLFVSTTHASHDESDTEVEQQAAALVPLANLNLGWSF
jgi:hypothetical protein